MARIVIALGGNALGDTPAEQRKRIDAAAPSLVGLIKQGHEIIVSHGNGPQVGMIKAAFDTAAGVSDTVARFPLAECTALSQGYIGWHLQNGILRELRREGLPWQVASVVTQIEVDPDDPAFSAPSKPIGGFVSAGEAARRMAADPSLLYKEDAGRGWRQVVASPKPVAIVERESILNLLDAEFVVVACGGGGIPVVRRGEGDYVGVDAVIDKDYASALLAEAVDAECLFILTAVERVCINYGKPDELPLRTMTRGEARHYIREGHFAAGSMLPKVEAAIRFVGGRKDRRAVIASLENAPLAMKGGSGTVITGF